MFNYYQCNNSSTGMIIYSFFVYPKDVIDEDVELNRKVSLQRMPSVGTAEEVHDEENDGYHYDDDDFEVRRRMFNIK